MRKAYLLPCSLLLLILVFSLWSSRTITEKTNRWRTQIQTAGQLAQLENWGDAVNTLRESYADWSAHQIWLRTTVRHDMIDDAEELYHRSMSFANAKKSDEFQAEIAGLLTKLSLLAETERLSLQNIL